MHIARHCRPVNLAAPHVLGNLLALKRQAMTEATGVTRHGMASARPGASRAPSAASPNHAPCSYTTIGELQVSSRWSWWIVGPDQFKVRALIPFPRFQGKYHTSESNHDLPRLKYSVTRLDVSVIYKWCVAYRWYHRACSNYIFICNGCMTIMMMTFSLWLCR